MSMRARTRTRGAIGNDTALSRGNPYRLRAAAWYRADFGITIATGVSQWLPILGGGTLAQATAGAQPLFVASAVNGKPAVRGDGTDDVLGPVAFTRNQPETLNLVYKSVVIGAPSVNDVILDGNAQLAGGAFLSDTTPQYYIFSGAAGALKSALVANGAYAYVTGQYNGASSVLRANGVEVDTGNAGATAAAGLTLFASGGAPIHPSNSEIAEVEIYSRLLSLSELARSDNYHRARYGLA